MAAALMIVRPYSPAIRARISAVLTRLGYGADTATVFAKGTPDEAILKQLATTPPPGAFLMPFHAHVDTEGNNVDGLALLMKIRARLPAYASIPVVMPVSQVGHAGYLMRLKELGLTSLPHHAAVAERELDDPDTLGKRLKGLGF